MRDFADWAYEAIVEANAMLADLYETGDVYPDDGALILARLNAVLDSDDQSWPSLVPPAARELYNRLTCQEASDD